MPSTAGPEVSRQEDPFNLYYGQGGLIPPPFLYQVLVDLHDASDILGSAVDASE